MITQKWATPIYEGKFDPREMLSYILANHRPEDNKHEANHNLFDDDAAPIQNFKQQAYNDFRHYIQESFGADISTFDKAFMKGWIAHTRGNYSMRSHNHSKSQFSAVYYFIADDGDVIFTDPRLNANRSYGAIFSNHFEEHTITPKVGTFTIVPSYLWHYVTPSSKLRICIPVDIFLTE